MVRLAGPLLLAIAAGAARAAADAPPGDLGALGGAGGFHTEGHAAIDDVFGDANDYRRTIDRFLELSTRMATLRDEFASAVQMTLTELGVRGPRPPGVIPRRGCPVEQVATPYARANRLGGEYLHLGRELTRHHEQVREFDRLGESVGLTPDYRAKVRRVLVQYRALVTDYREMKIAFHDQLVDELHYAGCDLWALIQKGDPQARPRPDGSKEDEWPAPGAAGAPGVPGPAREPPSEQPPPGLPPERVPPAAAIPLPRRPNETASRTGILFYVDNTKCRRPTAVILDGARLGEVAAGTRAGYQSQAGPHDLCLLDDPQRRCGQPGTVRRSYLHEGWTITLRCD